MKVVCLGGAGAMASSCVYDLHKTSEFTEIVIADYDENLANKVINMMDNDSRFSFVKLDASSKEDVKRVLQGADFVVDGLPFKYMENYMDAAAELGISGVSVNNIGEPEVLARYDEAFKAKGKTMLVGNGGCATTCIMSMAGCDAFDEVDDIHIHWGMWRPITHATPGLVETILWEYDPREPGRRFWEHGTLHRNTPPFGLPMEVEFPEPIGKQEPHIIMHWEPETLPSVPIIKEKRTKKIVVRGIWHYSWTRLIRVMLENGIFEAKPIVVNGAEVSPYDVLVSHVIREAQEEWEDPYEMADNMGFNPHAVLTVEMIGYENGIGKRTMMHKRMPYPYFDGKRATSSMEYGSYVGLPASISVQMLLKGQIDQPGAVTIENTGIDPHYFIDELKKRGVEFMSDKYIRGKGNIAEKPVNPPVSKEYRSWHKLQD